MNDEQNDEIVSELAAIHNGVMLLFRQKLYREAYDQNILSRQTYRKYLSNLLKEIDEMATERKVPHHDDQDL